MTEELFRFHVQEPVPDVSRLTDEQVRQYILESLQSQAASAQQASVGPSPAADLPRFYELLNQALANQQAKEGAVKTVKLVEGYPPTDFQGEVITFSLRRREPATFSQERPFSVGKRNYKPILREAFPDPREPGYLTLVFGLLFDNLVELTCWALTHKEANARALWLEELMLSYAWYFRQGGVNQLVYFGRDQDMVHTSEDNQRLLGRPLLYYLRTEKLYTVREKTIDELVVSLRAATS